MVASGRLYYIEINRGHLDWLLPKRLVPITQNALSGYK